MSFLDTIFNPIFGPLLNLGAFWGIAIISLLITVAVTLVYKYTTDQKEMKRIKEQLKQYQKQMREVKDPKKVMEINKKAMELNFKYMGSSFKSTLYTFIPMIIIFAWLSGTIAYHPLTANDPFTVTAEFGKDAKGTIEITSIPELTVLNGATQEISNNIAEWQLQGTEGEYKLTFKYNTEEYSKNIKIADKGYENPLMQIPDSKLKSVTIGNKPVHPLGDKFHIFSWYPGWLGVYIILSILFSLGIRNYY